MSETKNPGEKKLSVSGKTLTLKPRSETGTVRQSFSHGRSKQVVVEKVKRARGRRAKPRRKPRPQPKQRSPPARRLRRRPPAAPRRRAKPRPSPKLQASYSAH